MTIHDDLAATIFDEMTAVLGPLHSDHLARDLDVGDVLDAVHIATDDDRDPVILDGLDGDNEPVILVVGGPDGFRFFGPLPTDEIGEYDGDSVSRAFPGASWWVMTLAPMPAL